MPDNFTIKSKEFQLNSTDIMTFLNNCSTDIDIWQYKKLSKNSNDNKNVDGFELSQRYVCVPDNTRVAKPVIYTFKPQQVTTEAKTEAKPKNGMTDYLTDFKDYKPSNPQKYNKVLAYINKKVKGEHGIAIANMVCAKSEDYGIDPEITARILDVETGGFVFNERSMNPTNNSHKGVMQVDRTTIECMYADPKNANNTKLSKHQRAVAYDHRHFVADQERIDQLKKQYPTVDDLYNAIQTDVTLGLEVGIMAYKGKLSRHKGDVKSALAEYCGSQYKLNQDSTAVRKIWPLPKYKEGNR